jgi:small subunit ribosomal protein S17
MSSHRRTIHLDSKEASEDSKEDSSGIFESKETMSGVTISGLAKAAGVEMVKSLIPPKKARPIVGWVVSSGLMQKTVKVRVPRIVLVPKYRKYVTRHSVLLVHDDKGECDVGDKVEMKQSRPYSKMKHHVVTQILVKDPGTAYLRENPHLARTRLELKLSRRQRELDESAYKDAERLKRQQQRTQEAEIASQNVEEANSVNATNDTSTASSDVPSSSSGSR